MKADCALNQSPIIFRCNRLYIALTVALPPSLSATAQVPPPPFFNGNTPKALKEILLRLRAKNTSI
jgi:hypothetical protein